MSKRAILLGIFLLFVTGLFLSGVLFTKKPQSMTLHDGTVFELLKVTTAGNHVIRTGPNWEKLLGWLPAQVRAYLPQSDNEYRSNSTSPVGIWVSYFRPPLTKAKWLLSGEDGIELQNNAEEYRIGIAFIGFPSFPLNAKELTVAAITKEKEKRIPYYRGSEFHFETPTNAAPALPVLPLPQTQGDHDLNVTLTTLKVAPIRKAPTYGDELGRLQTEAAFDVVEKGIPATKHWQPCQITVSDQTGQLFQSGPSGSNRCVISPMPYPSPENPWHLEVMFRKKSSFDKTELVTFENIRISKTGDEVLIGEIKTINGCEVELVKTGVGAPFQDERRTARLYLTVRSGPPNTAATLVQCTSSLGGKIDHWGGSLSRNAHEFGIASIPKEAETVTATFAIHRTHTFEFFAQPELVESLKP